MATTFAFRMRAYSAAHFLWGDHLEITWPNAVAVIQSEFTGGQNGNAYPVTIHGEIRGESESLDLAEPFLAGLIGETLAPLALAGNAAIAEPLAISTYGVDLSEPRPFRAYKTPEPDEFFPPGRRFLDLAATKELVGAIGAHEETELLRRAVEAYRHALGYWTPEARLLAGEFLYISSETLSRFLVESRAKERGITPKNLARLEGFKGADGLRSHLLDEIFGEDQEVRDGLEKASNGFEHGYLPSGRAVDLVDPVLERAFGLVRTAVIENCGVERGVQDVLLADAFAEPRTLLPPLHVVEGEISAKDPELGTDEMPIGAIDLRWNGGRPVVVGDKEEVKISFEWNIQVARLPENVQLHPLRQGLRAAYVRQDLPSDSAEPQ